MESLLGNAVVKNQFGLGTSLGTPFTMIPHGLFHTLSLEYILDNVNSRISSCER